MRGIDEAVFNVSADSRSEKCGFLRYKAYLRSKPLQVQIANINAIQAHGARVEIIEPLDKGDHGRLPRSRSTNECHCLSSRECETKVEKLYLCFVDNIEGAEVV